MTIDKLQLQRATQAVIKSLHLPGFAEKDIIALGRMIYSHGNNKWLENHELMRLGYNDEYYEQISDVPNESTSIGQW